jgi:hypothetical protein
LGYGAAKSVLGGFGEAENLVRKTVPEYFGAKSWGFNSPGLILSRMEFGFHYLKPN